jgi:hypothetical protein
MQSAKIIYIYNIIKQMGRKNRRRSSSSRRVNQRSTRRSTRVKRGNGSRIKRNSRKKGSLRPKRTKRIRRRNKIQVGGASEARMYFERQQVAGPKSPAPTDTEKTEIRELITEFYRLKKQWFINNKTEMNRIIKTLAEKYLSADEELIQLATEKAESDEKLVEIRAREDHLTDLLVTDGSYNRQAGDPENEEISRAVHENHQLAMGEFKKQTEYRIRYMDGKSIHGESTREAFVSQTCQFMLNEFLEQELKGVDLTTRSATPSKSCRLAMQSVIKIFKERNKNPHEAAFLCGFADAL